MKIGFDVDGVLANFNQAYVDLFIELFEKDLFEPGDANDPPTWHYPQHRGYSDEEVAAVWKVIANDPTFWTCLEELDGAEALRRHLVRLVLEHDVYFITSRPGNDAKWQTELWLTTKMNIVGPTVLISGKKGLSCAALSLDAYIDDNLDNVLAVAKDSPYTRVYLLDAAYNQSASLPAAVTRISAIQEMLFQENL